MRVVSLLPAGTDILDELGVSDHLDQEETGAADLVLAGPGQVPGLQRDPACVVEINPRSVEDVLELLIEVGRHLGLEDRARASVARLADRMLQTQSVVNPYLPGVRTCVIAKAKSLIINGLWTVQLLERAGAEPVIVGAEPLAGFGTGSGLGQSARIGGPSREITPAEVVAAGPEAVILAMGHGEASELVNSRWWGGLPAARGGRVVRVDPAWFDTPSPRLWGTFDWLVGWLHDRPALIEASGVLSHPI